MTVAPEPSPGATAPTTNAPIRTAGHGAAVNPLGVAGLASLTAIVVVAFVMGRPLWFFSDDWNIFVNYHSGNLLEPFNGHLSLFPAGVYQAIFHSLGVDAYWPFRVFGLVGYALLGVEVWRFARSRLGDGVALLAVTAVAWSSAATTNVLFPFLVNYSVPIAAMIAMWRALDRDTPRSDVVGSAWLALALATSGLGLMAVAALVVELAWTRAPLRRWLTFAPGPALWLVWYVGHRSSTPITDDWGTAFRYAGRMFLGGTTALAAGWKPGGWVLAIAFVGLVVGSIATRQFRARAAAALVAPVAFIVTTAMTRTAIVPPIPPDEVRYRWAVAAYLVLAAVVAWPRERGRLPSPAPLVAGTVAMAVLVVGAVRLVGDMGDWRDLVVENEPGLRAVTLAVETVEDPAEPDLRLPLSFVKVTADGYLGAVDDVGSPNEGHVFTGPGGKADQTSFADHYLVEQSRTRVEPMPPSASCPSRDVTEAPAGRIVAVDASGMTTPGSLRVARFGSFDDAPTVALTPSSVGILRLPTDPPYVDAEAVPYRFEAPAGVVLVLCS